MLKGPLRLFRWLWGSVILPYMVLALAAFVLDGIRVVAHLGQSLYVLSFFVLGRSHRSFPLPQQSLRARRGPTGQGTTRAHPPDTRRNIRASGLSSGIGSDSDDRERSKVSDDRGSASMVSLLPIDKDASVRLPPSEPEMGAALRSIEVHRRILFGKRGQHAKWLPATAGHLLVPPHLPLIYSKSLHRLVSSVIGAIQQPTVSTLPTRQPFPQWPPHYVPSGASTLGNRRPDTMTDDGSTSASFPGGTRRDVVLLDSGSSASEVLPVPPRRYRRATTVVYRRVSTRQVNFSSSRSPAPAHPIASITAHHVLSYQATRQKVLVVDLDETLCHVSTTTENMLGPPTFSEVIPTAAGAELFHVWVRPYARLFLTTAAKLFNVVLFTAASQPYADTILRHLDPKHKLKDRYYRHDCRVVTRAALAKMVRDGKETHPGSDSLSATSVREDTDTPTANQAAHTNGIPTAAKVLLCAHFPPATPRDPLGAAGPANEDAKVLVKDLRVLKVPPELMIMVDNNEECTLLNRENALVVPPYIPSVQARSTARLGRDEDLPGCHDPEEDEVLLGLLGLLECLLVVPDVRSILRHGVPMRRCCVPSYANSRGHWVSLAPLLRTGRAATMGLHVLTVHTPSRRIGTVSTRLCAPKARSSVQGRPRKDALPPSPPQQAGALAATSVEGAVVTAKRRGRPRMRAAGVEMIVTNTTASPTVTTVDLVAAVEEWRALLIHSASAGATQTLAPSTGMRSAADSSSSSSPPVLHDHCMAPPPDDITLAERSAMLATLLRHTDLYPNLRHLFDEAPQHTASGSAALEGSISLLFVKAQEMVQCDTELQMFLSLLRAFRYSTTGKQVERIARYECLMSALTAAAGDAWCATQKALHDVHPGRMEMTRSIALILSELHRMYVDMTSESQPLPSAAAPKKTTGRGPRASRQRFLQWWASEVHGLLLGPVKDMMRSSALTQPAAPSAPHLHITQTVAEWCVALLAAELGGIAFTGKAMDFAELPRQWRDAASGLERVLHRTLEAAAHPAATIRVSVLLELLDTLQQAFVLGLVAQQRMQLMQRKACDSVRVICESHCSSVEGFPALCQPTVAMRVGALRGRSPSLYTQLCTVIFTAAVEYLHKKPAGIQGMVDAAETARREALLASGHAADKIPPRPPLHSPSTLLCYALLCAGYAPEGVVISGLCIGLSSLDLVEMAGAAALFSSSFALTQMPVRLRGPLTEDIPALLRRCVKQARHLCVTPTTLLGTVDGDEGGYGDSLPKRLERVLSMTDSSVTQSFAIAEAAPGHLLIAGSQRTLDTPKGLEDGAASDETDSFDSPTGISRTVDVALYVSIHAMTECLVRGDSGTASKLWLALLPLLDIEGGTRYLVQTLELITRGVDRRLQHLGRLEARAHRPSNTPLAMDQALVDLTGLVLPRVCEGMQRELQKIKRSSSVGHEVERRYLEQLMRLLTRLTVDALTCGMALDTAKQLTTLHATLLKAKGASISHEDGAREAFLVVERLIHLASDIKASRFCWARHPQSAAVRNCGIVLNDVVAVQLNSTAAAAAALNSTSTESKTNAPRVVTQRQRNYLLSVVHLLFRIQTDHPVQAEPAALCAFRTDILDPALTHVLTTSQVDLTLTTLTEIAVVMCVPRTIHHVSSGLFTGLASSVTSYMRDNELQAKDTVTGMLAERLLCSAAAVCVRSDDILTVGFMDMLAALGSHLSSSQVIRVLTDGVEQHMPADAPAVVNLLQRLVRSLQPDASQLSYTDIIATLKLLVCLDTDAHIEVPYARVMRHLTSEESLRRRCFSAGEAGVLVHVAAALHRRPPAFFARLNEEDRRCLEAVPRTLAAFVLQRIPDCGEHEVPPILAGYSACWEKSLREQMLRAFISRTTRAAPHLSPAEVVQCVEAYCIAGVYHAHLFGLLLSRVADVRQRFSLELSVRLLLCGIRSGDASVRTACLTAAQPVFVDHVRYLLQSDPHSLVSVSSTATTILNCLRVGFPHDPITAVVLENVARYHHVAGMAVTKAALRLTAARGSMEYAALRTLTTHCIEKLLPTARPQDFSELVDLLVLCGVRSNELFISVTARFAELEDEMDGAALARLAAALERARVELDKHVVLRFVRIALSHLAPLGKGKGRVPKKSAQSMPKPYTTAEVSTLLQLLYTAGRRYMLDTMPASDALLEYLLRVWQAHRDDRGGALVPATDIEVILRSCVEQTSRATTHHALARLCADRVAQLVAAAAETESKHHVPTPARAAVPLDNWIGSSVESLGLTVSATSSSLWQSDLLLVVNLASYLVRLGESGHPAVHGLFEILYEQRGALMRRQLLWESTEQTLRAAGKDAHKELYAVVVEGKLTS